MKNVEMNMELYGLSQEEASKMSKEEFEKYMLNYIHGLDKDGLLEYLEDTCRVYNDSIQSGDFNTATFIDEFMKEAINTYTGIVSKECYDSLAKEENPMMAAIIQYEYETVRTTDKKVGKNKIPVREVVPTDKKIDVYRLHKMVDGGIGVDKTWWNMAEKLNLLLTVQVAKKINVDPTVINNSFAMAEISKKIAMGATPTSNTSLLKSLNLIIQAMLGDEYKAKSFDVNYLVNVYAKADSKKKLAVKCSSHKEFRQLIVNVCHNVVTGCGYDVTSKEMKTK